MIVKTEAIVLKSMNYRDTSKIVTFYTRSFGKLKGIAKGARQMRSKFGGALEPLSQVALVFYRKEQRELHLISQCDSVTTYKNIPTDLDRMSVALSVLELVNQLSHDEEANERLFSLIVDTLNAVENSAKNPINLFYAFELRCAAILGFSPDFGHCFSCGRSIHDAEADGSVILHLAKGSALCSECSAAERSRRTEVPARPRTLPGYSPGSDESRIRISLGTVKTLSYLLNAPLEAVTSLELGAAGGNEIDGTLRLYMRQHFEDLRPVKSLDMLRKIGI